MMIADLTICYMLFSCASKYQNERTCDDLRIYLRNFAGILRVRQSLRLGAHYFDGIFGGNGDINVAKEIRFDGRVLHVGIVLQQLCVDTFACNTFVSDIRNRQQISRL